MTESETKFVGEISGSQEPKTLSEIKCKNCGGCFEIKFLLESSFFTKVTGNLAQKVMVMAGEELVDAIIIPYAVEETENPVI